MSVFQNHSSSIEHSSIERSPLLAVPNPEVLERPKRRRYPAEYKRRILREIESATQSGQVGAILRREGLYYSNIQCWQLQRERGVLEGLSPKKRGRKQTKAEVLIKKNKELERKVGKLQRRLKRAELLLDIQKKISEITGIPLRELENEEED